MRYTYVGTQRTNCYYNVRPPLSATKAGLQRPQKKYKMPQRKQKIKINTVDLSKIACCVWRQRLSHQRLELNVSWASALNLTIRILLLLLSLLFLSSLQLFGILLESTAKITDGRAVAAEIDRGVHGTAPGCKKRFRPTVEFARACVFEIRSWPVRRERNYPFRV